MPRRKDAPVAPDDRRRWEIFRAADAIRAERKERVSLRSIRAWMKRNGLVPGNNQCVGEHFAAWTAKTGYSPAIELSGMPEAMATQLAKAGAQLWEAAQAEAAAVHGSHCRRMEEAIAAERELRNEALALLDAREETIEAQRKELAWYAGELDRMKGHVRDVRARDFWSRVADEIWRILPEREAMHLSEIAGRVGHEFVKEAEDHPGEWGPELLRGVIDQRVKFRKLFAKDGAGRYRRRRREDDAPGAAPVVPDGAPDDLREAGLGR